MNFNLDEAIEVLERTPQTLEYFLLGLSDSWLQSNEGKGTWNVNEVIDHLIECERNNWMPRLQCILEKGDSKPFPPFNRFSHLYKNDERSIQEKLIEFKTIRTENVTKLISLNVTGVQLELKGSHPEFGIVKLRELLSTWVVHDLTHMSQIVRVMAERYRTDVGPWKAYLSILKNRE
jgi:DinB superfamily